MLAFSYVRFSSVEQSKGDSLRRQTEVAQKYASEHGLQLDTSLTFRDLGVSAFTGAHRAEGALAAFIAACKSGRVPRGSALLVESIDRLSREQIRKAVRFILELIDDHKIEIHTTSDGRVYGQGSEMPDVMYLVMVAARANEESATKSKRVRAAQAKAKASIAVNPGVSVGGRVPAWIRSERGKPFELHADRAVVVRKMFELCLSGLGDFLIARHCNEHFAPWNEKGGFHHSYVQKVLTHPAAYGAYRPYGAGDLVTGHYPAVIDFATFEKVRQLRSSRNREKLGPTDPLMRNLFGGLVVDVTDGLPGINMVFHNKRSQLMTDSYRIGKTPNRLKYADFEWAFMRFLDQLDFTTVLDIAASEDLQTADKELAKLIAEIAYETAQAEKLMGLLVAGESKMLRSRFDATEANLERLQASKETTEKRLAEIRQQNNELLSEDVVFATLAAATDAITRARLRQEIRRKVGKIYLRWNRETGNVGGIVKFANGVARFIVFTGAEIITATPEEETVEHAGPFSPEDY